MKAQLLHSLRGLDGLLRGESAETTPGPAELIRAIFALGGFYGVCMGLYAALRGSHGTGWQMLASALKIPLLFLLTLLVTFPSLYVFSALSRSTLPFRASLHTLIRSIAVSIVLLASFGPITAFFTLSTSSYPFMVLLNVAVLTLVGIAGLKYLAHALETMFDAKEQSSRILRIWIGIYGAAMGTFGGWRWQILFSALKVPLLIATCTVVCLPTFFVLHLLLGIGDDFGAAIRGVLAGQATMAICLAALAPATAFFYASITDYELAVMGNGAPFLVATLAGQMTLSRYYAPLIARDDRHILTRNAWMFLYVFIAIQAAWVLRPFVGSPDLPVRFFREEAWDNAYVRIFRTIQRIVG